MKSKYIFLYLILVIAVFLRLYKLGLVPNSLHGDEIGVGYNAYSLLKSGIDEYGKSWPWTFRFDVAPLIFYFTVPFLAIIGKSDYAIRFPSVIVGVVTIWALVYLTRQIFILIRPKIPDIKIIKVSLIAGILLSITPWHIQISRIIHDADYGLCIQLWALGLFFNYLSSGKKWQILLSCVLFGISFYAYHGPRLTSPLLLLAFIYVFIKHYQVSFRKIILSLVVFILIIIPITINSLSKPVSETRFGGVNIFIRSNSTENLLSIPVKFTLNFLNQYDPRPLFFNSEFSRYFNVKNSGLIYPALLIWFIFGLVKISQDRTLFKFILLWLVISVLPGALTSGPPNGGRIILFLPVFIILSAYGLLNLNTKSIFKYVTLLILGMNIFQFLNNYFNDSPLLFYRQWGYGTKELVQYLTSQETNYDQIIVSEDIKQAYIYVLWYGNKDPEWLKNVNKIQYPLVGYTEMGKYKFINLNSISRNIHYKRLIVTSDMNTDFSNQVFKINLPNQQTIYKIYTD